MQQKCSVREETKVRPYRGVYNALADLLLFT